MEGRLIPRLPTQDDINQSRLSSRPIVQGPRSYVGQGLQAVGQSFQQVSDIQARREDADRQQNNAVDYARAQAHWNSSVAEAEAGYTLDQNPDYGKWGERFSKQTTKFRDEASGLIRDPKLKARFDAQITDNVTQANMRILEKARTVDQGMRRAHLEDSIHTQINTALRPGMDKTESSRIIGDLQAAIHGAVDSGLVDPGVGVNLQREVGNKYAYAQQSNLTQTAPDLAVRQMSGGTKAAVATDELIKKAGPVDFERLAAAVGQTESGGNLQAESPVGASGSHQVMPPTARDIASQTGDKAFPYGGTTEEVKAYLKSGNVSERYGKFYLSQQLNKYGGDLEAALIAYNAGPGNADKWLAANRDYSVLPKRKETEPYVRKVMKSYGVQASPYDDFLKPEQRQQLIDEGTRLAKDQAQKDLQDRRVRAEVLADTLKEDIISHRQTGQPVQGVDINETEIIDNLGQPAYDAWREQRDVQRDIWTNTDKMPTQTSAGVTQTIQDADHAAKVAQGTALATRTQQVAEETRKIGGALLKERQDNPGAAALKMPGVADAETIARDPRSASPQTTQMFLKKFRQAQLAFNTPRDKLQVVPDEWAAGIAKKIEEIPTEQNKSNKAIVDALINENWKKLHATYGSSARDVLLYSIDRFGAAGKGKARDAFLAPVLRVARGPGAAANAIPAPEDPHGALYYAIFGRPTSSSWAYNPVKPAAAAAPTTGPTPEQLATYKEADEAEQTIIRDDWRTAGYNVPGITDTTESQPPPPEAGTE